MRQNTAMKLGAIAAVTAVALAGCSAAEDGPSTSDFDTAMSTPTEITMWAWAPGIEAQVALFEEAYPEIDVVLENVGQGGEHYTKVRTALEAGTGAPDVAQFEYQYIPSFVLTENLLDLAPYGAGDVEDQFTPWTWAQVTNGDAIYAIPQDAGPMGNLYREDILSSAGITEAPVTWEDYTAAAEAVKADSGSYISSFSGNDAGSFLGLLWAAGATPFTYDGDQTVSVSLTDPESQKVVDYWQDLIDRDLVAVDPSFTDGWYQGLANGAYAGWLTAAWGPAFLQGTAADTSGLWRAAPLPQFDAADPIAGNWGGSTLGALSSTEHPIVAAELAKFINTDSAATLAFATEQSLFPTRTEVLTASEFVDQESEFYGGQRVNEIFAEISTTVDTDFQWLPFQDQVASSFVDTLGKEISERGDLSAGLAAWQDAIVTYATDQGFTVE
ncbi:extracellular solute-binding protein [Microcella daejeonensis]|uniref:Extracellular solute-binding protein n=1 Tax=Microcella daejeonensis TaxID=2994971 RepID=A0A9E8MIZ2_9MICO|nr:extracellular solute-binding protein [Microcella daejeonensis]WAB80411.1 extracellular solute-binding protein [Microcella daejeonensis]WAB85025.1 extracellular solute-binding protein [Microcella daejeonensis]